MTTTTMEISNMSLAAFLFISVLVLLLAFLMVRYALSAEARREAKFSEMDSLQDEIGLIEQEKVVREVRKVLEEAKRDLEE